MDGWVIWKGFEPAQMSFADNCTQREGTHSQGTRCLQQQKWQCCRTVFYWNAKCTSLKWTSHLESWKSGDLSWESAQNCITGQWQGAWVWKLFNQFRVVSRRSVVFHKTPTSLARSPNGQSVCSGFHWNNSPRGEWEPSPGWKGRTKVFVACVLRNGSMFLTELPRDTLGHKVPGI